MKRRKSGCGAYEKLKQQIFILTTIWEVNCCVEQNFVEQSQLLNYRLLVVNSLNLQIEFAENE